MDDRVVITGAGIVCAIGFETAEVWDQLLTGKHGIHPVEGYDVSGFANQMAAQVHGLNAESLDIHPRDSRIMNKHSLMLIKCAQDAFQQAGFHEPQVPSDKIGFYAGMGMVDYEIEDLLSSVVKSLDAEGNLDYERFFLNGYHEIFPLWPLSMLNNISFCQAAIRLGICGENTVFSPHADSGVQAIVEAITVVRSKNSLAVLAGGVSEKISPLSLAREHLHGKDGGWRTVLGEGCGILSLELQSAADARGADYLASVSGYGFALEPNDEKAEPTDKTIAQSMQQAVEAANVKPEDINLIITHGDCTGTGNRNEVEAIHDVFASCLDKIKSFSTKGAIGHLLAAAPVVDAIIGMQILKHGIIPATIKGPGATEPEGKQRIDVIFKEPFKEDVNRILINCRSYEGQCASLVLEKVADHR